MDIREKECVFLTNILPRGSECSATAMPGVDLKSPLRDLIPIESLAGPGQERKG
jgi:hypothetical protein